MQPISAKKSYGTHQQTERKEGWKKTGSLNQKTAGASHQPADDPRDDRYYATRSWAIAEVSRIRKTIPLLSPGATRDALHAELERIKREGFRALGPKFLRSIG